MSQRENQIASMSAAKSKVLDQFDEGEITFREAFVKLDKLQSDEINLLLQRELTHKANLGTPKPVLLGLILLAVAAGFFASPHIYPKLFGYKTAEQCVLEAKHQWAVGVCYELYSSNTTPSKSTAATLTAPANSSVLDALNKDEPGRYEQITDPRELARLNDPAYFTPVTADAPKPEAHEAHEAIGDPIQVALAERLPVNGTVVWYGTLKAGVAPLEIKSSKGGHYLVKLTNAITNEDVMSIIVVGGSAVNAKVPLGKYVIKYAAGEQWYGYEKYFGPTTTFTKADTLFDFREEGDFVDGHSITLYKVKGGNLRTHSLSAKDF